LKYINPLKTKLTANFIILILKSGYFMLITQRLIQIIIKDNITLTM